MAIEMHYLEERRFMLTVVHGEIHDEQLMEHVQELNQVTAGVSDLRELADSRQITDLERLSVRGTTLGAAHEIPRLEGKLAILVTDSPLMFGLARAYQAFAQNQRGSVEIFHELDEALEFLAEGEEDLQGLREFVAGVGRPA